VTVLAFGLDFLTSRGSAETSDCTVFVHYFRLCFSDWQSNAFQVRFRVWGARNCHLLYYYYYY